MERARADKSFQLLVCAACTLRERASQPKLFYGPRVIIVIFKKKG
jgi:hypothetical protein